MSVCRTNKIPKKTRVVSISQLTIVLTIPSSQPNPPKTRIRKTTKKLGIAEIRPNLYFSFS